MHREELVVEVGRVQGLPGCGQLGPDEQRLDAPEQEEEHRRDAVHDPDALVVDGGEPAAPPRCRLGPGEDPQRAGRHGGPRRELGKRCRSFVPTIAMSLLRVDSAASGLVVHVRTPCASHPRNRPSTPTTYSASARKATSWSICSTNLSLVRHFNWVHLAGGAQLAIATRNCLSANHPLYRLLWPYIYATQQSNDVVTRGQMARGGDFESIFSFTFEGMCRLFDDGYLAYRHIVNDPEADGDARGVRGVGFETPTQDNLEALFEVMHRFVCIYLGIYLPRNSAIGPSAVGGDVETQAWLEELNARVPNGVGVCPSDVTWNSLARLLARQLFMVTAQHEILGSFMWDYQLWTHRQPARVYEDFRREPLDIYQRLVNANYNLNVHRRALMDDFSHVALTTAPGRRCCTSRTSCRAADNDGQPPACSMAPLPTRSRGQHQRLSRVWDLLSRRVPRRRWQRRPSWCGETS